MNALAANTHIYRLRWWTLVVIAISVLIVVLDSTIVNIALPTLQRELNTTLSELQWIINAYVMAFAALMLTMGALGDRIGRAKMLQAGLCSGWPQIIRLFLRNPPPSKLRPSNQDTALQPRGGPRERKVKRAGRPRLVAWPGQPAFYRAMIRTVPRLAQGSPQGLPWGAQGCSGEPEEPWAYVREPWGSLGPPVNPRTAGAPMCPHKLHSFDSRPKES